MIRHPRHRRLAAVAARAGAVASAAMLALSAWAAVDPVPTQAVAATNAGNATIADPTSDTALTEGGSDTDFAVRLPVGSACTGDSASDGYRVQSYMVPAAVDPASLTFGATGPLPEGTGAAFRQPLYAAFVGNPYVNGLTDLKVEPDPGGNISGIPVFDFSVFGADGPEIVPAGTYNLGIACTLGPPSATQIDKYWNVQMTVAHDAADEPAGLTWTVAASQAATTTLTVEVTPAGGAAPGEDVTITATVDPGAAEGTVTFLDGETALDTAAVQDAVATITVDDLAEGERALSASFAPQDPTAHLPATSNTVTYLVSAGATTTTTTTTAVDPSATTTTTTVAEGDPTTTTVAVVDSGFSGGSPTLSSVGQLPRTGGSVLSMVVWGALLVAFGRMAVLLGRTPAVIPATV